nr:unnamed protein product [Callosobruchus chinensis]
MLIRWKNKDKDKEKCEKGSSQKQNSTMGTSKKKRKFGRDGEEEWNSDSKSGRGNDSTVIDVIYRRKLYTEDGGKTNEDIEEPCDKNIFSCDSDSNDTLAEVPEAVTIHPDTTHAL